MELKSLYPRISSRLITVGDCWEWQGARIGKGYGHIRYGGKNYLVHRISYEYHKGPSGNLQVRHQCHNKICCNPSHLLLGTNQENCDDDVRDGRRKGENNGRVIITKEQAKRVKSFSSIFTNKEIASIVKIPKYIVANIRQGKSWKEV